jgi:hypothetical protein
VVRFLGAFPYGDVAPLHGDPATWKRIALKQRPFSPPGVEGLERDGGALARRAAHVVIEVGAGNVRVELPHVRADQLPRGEPPRRLDHAGRRLVDEPVSPLRIEDHERIGNAFQNTRGESLSGGGRFARLLHLDQRSLELLVGLLELLGKRLSFLGLCLELGGLLL